ncbi:hypothetical protein [Sulfobacillus harzensis]|uniref:TraC-like domain-containing protein n=1 Tax=Sulfobacillus harzensis TaxID=2729629 RepID=A0A7Y0L536_9FIRM|nr:hypothetical protein [Sulfobacillus harzensis]NMP23483.1 hypothetical protein [Sulfobacillus harzensis]
MTRHWTPTKKHSTAPAAQDRFPIQDIRNGCLVRDDGAVVGGLALSPLNLALKSPRETRAVITAVYAILNSLRTPWQIVSLYRPLDLDQYVESLKDRLRQVAPRREPLLRQYLEWVLAQQDAGQAMERRYYCLMTRTGPDAVELHQETLPEVAQEWNRIRGMRATVLDDAAWESVIFGFFHPTRLNDEGVPGQWTALTQTSPDARPLNVRPKEVSLDATTRVDSVASS